MFKFILKELKKEFNVEDNNIGSLGGKAYHLLELVSANILVPKAFVLPTDYYREKIKEAGLEKLINTIISQSNETKRNEISKDERRKLLTQIRNAIFDFSLGDEIYKAIQFVLTSLPANSRVSVRSSGTLEDMQHYSFAGQYDTFLNLSSVEDIVESIKKCWASIWKENTLSYLDDLPVGSLKPEMAIIIQHQIPSEISGVLFTLNSQSGNENEMIIESIWGLGEGVVSGEITPDSFVVDLTTSSVIDHNIVEKQYKIIGKDTEGISKVPTSNDEKSISTLNNEQLSQLVKVGIEIASLYGYPQDIEWAIYDSKLYILQTRAITTIQFDSNLGQWTNANFVEVFPGFHNPLSFSLTGKAFTDTLQEFFIQSKIWRNPPSKDQREDWHTLFFGRCYWKVSAVKDLLTQIPGFNERSFDKTTGVDIQYEGEGRTTGWTLGRIIWGIPVLLKLESLYGSFHKEVKEYINSYFERERDLIETTGKLSELSDDDLENYIKKLFDLHLEANYYAQFVSFLAAQSQDDFHVFLDKINKNLKSVDKIDVGNLFTGLSDVKTAQPLIELNNLAETISSNPTSKFYILNNSVEQIISDLKNHNPSVHEMNECVNGLNQYIDKFFWMTSTDEDLSLPRWKEDSSFAVILLKKLVENQNFSTSIEVDQIEIREVEEIKARNVMGRGMGKLRIFRNRSFWKQVENVKSHSWWREEARYILSRLYYFVYKAVDVLGSRYVQKNIIKEKSDIYKLTFEDLLEYIASRKSETIKEKISKYAQMYNMFKNFGPPSTIGGIFHKDGELERDDTYEGVGCSPGIVRGRARVVNNLTEVDQIQPKEILIVPYTNPGWTPVFSLISGIVMEEGGLLSHGAVVARECGIPAILQIENCTKVIKTGTLIEINGTTGSLSIIK